MSIISQNHQNCQSPESRISVFFKKYSVSRLLANCGAVKEKGISVITIFQYLLCLMFSDRSMYMQIRTNHFHEDFSPNTVYRFLNNVKIHWERFTGLLCERIVNEFLRPLTDDDRRDVFIFDDSSFHKRGHKKTELVARVFDHVEKKFIKGFRMLTLGWSDGNTFVPITHRLLSSANDNNVLGVMKSLDKRSIAFRRRKEAREKATDVMMTMLKNAQKIGHHAKYVLFDSWFSSPKVITQIKNDCQLDTIAMIKKSVKIKYMFEGELKHIKQIPDDKPIVAFSISEYDNMELPYTLCCKVFSADIYRLNLFAERLKNLDFSEMTAFKSLLIANPECTFEDMLMMTYGLDSVIVYPCRDCCELGETVIENEMIPEIESCSDEILELLDREKIGRLMQEREGGVFIDGYYCVTSGYEPPDINIEIGRPENCFFRLLIVAEEEKIDQAQWVSLPCEAEITCDFYNGICLDFQSALPNLKFDDTHKIGTLNELAEQISQLSHDDFVKLKAVMECEQIHEISDTIDCISRLSEYQLDSKISDSSEFGKKYLLKNMPADFNFAILENTNLCNFGQKILCHKQGEITSYGAVSGRGQELYSTLTVQPKQQLDEDFEEDYEEDFEMEMGGLQ